MGLAPARLLDAGEAALVVEYGDTIDPAIHDRVMALDAALEAEGPKGIVERVPSYRSLMVHYDPLALSREALVTTVRALEQVPRPAAKRRRWIVPMCYGASLAEDLPHLAKTFGMTEKRVVELHASATYRIYMYGFAPGFCYLGGHPPELTLPRRVAPRPPTPANVVMTAAGMSIITTISMPTGWWILGRTAERMFSTARRESFFAHVGDEVRFEAIDLATFEALDARAAKGELVAREAGA
jgi:KipI family sensor histidine kinase inhibitor